MAARYGAGQYEDAFSAPRLQNWSVARHCRRRPSPRDGSTQPLANDRGHLLPSVRRSQVSPWGTFVGTWEMPARIPPPKLNLTARSAAAAAQLCGWIRTPTALSTACNGGGTVICGQPQESCRALSATAEPRSGNEDTRGAQPSPTAALEEQWGSDAVGQNAARGEPRGRGGAKAHPEGAAPSEGTERNPAERSQS
ncbi:protein Flattop [Gallus gallus]|uniref:Protein Flattop n=1 Tax=Gallus gallus TaxID=9031 RepID=A0A3Q2U3Q9_CHICK|nr:protein Flattop [Gallus gallus]XP_040546754.1 protein Flattop [Gallus gallus]|eukprot:XP_024999423.1 protein Flattop isoform X1 [Gallus gallus]